MKGKFVREEKARFDKQQTIFFNGANTLEVKSNNFRFAKIEESKIDFTRKVTCPFCLSWLPLSKFIISTKKGFNHGLGKCPECNNGMRIKTLFALGKWTPQDYAKFVVEYPYGAFFHKINPIFQTWKQKLTLMNWSIPFWEEYRKLNPKIEESIKEDDYFVREETEG